MTSRVSLRPSATYCGVPVYLRYSNVDEELAAHPKEVRAIEIAKSAGWRSALQNLYDPSMVKYATDPARLQFLEVLPVSKETVALEIGVGFGQFTGALASRVRWLDTFEVRLVNAIFTKIRCEQETVENVGFACGGDDCRLPFASDCMMRSFSILYSNGVPAETARHQKRPASIGFYLRSFGFLNPADFFNSIRKTALLIACCWAAEMSILTICVSGVLCHGHS